MTGDEFYQNDNTFQFKHMFQQKLVSSSVIYSTKRWKLIFEFIKSRM